MAVVTVPGYSDLVEIGRGGNAIVFSAVMEDLGRKVALKVLVQLDLDGHQLRRFETEARSMGQLAWHPNIVQVFGVGRTELGQPFIAMELLERPLSHRLKQEGPIAATEAITIGIQIANALGAAHEINVVHRDIKPANILITRHGDVKLADFGIAILEGSTTITGSMAGTVGYMAPEVIKGERATPLTDIYSLGATLFALTTGTPPFVRSTDETPYAALNRVLESPPPDPRSHGVPDALAAVLERSMARNPTDRHTSAGELESDLRRALEDPGLADAPPVMHEPTSVIHEPPPAPPEPSSADVPPVADTLTSARNATTIVRNPVTSPSRSRRSRVWLAAAIAAFITASGATALALSAGASKSPGPTSTTSTSTTAAPSTTAATTTTVAPTIPVASSVPAPELAPVPAPIPSAATTAKPRSDPTTKKSTSAGTVTPASTSPTQAPPTPTPPTPAPPTQPQPTQPPAPTGPSTTLRPPPR